MSLQSRNETHANTIRRGKEDMRRTSTRVFTGKVDCISYEGLEFEADDGEILTHKSMFDGLQGKRIRVTIEDLTELRGDEVDV